MTEVPLWAAMAFMAVVGTAAFICAEKLEKIEKHTERQAQIMAQILYLLENRNNR